MERLKNVAVDTRIFRCGAIYYHRAAVPKDIVNSYGKREETFSLNTSDHAEAVRKVRIAAVDIDRKFDAHGLKLAGKQADTLKELSGDQIAAIKAVYLRFRLEEDEEVRLGGFEELDDSGNPGSPVQYEPRATFDEHVELVDDVDACISRTWQTGPILSR